MASPGTAIAPSTREIIGPVFTSAGFQYWYLACYPDCVVAVPQGALTGMFLAMSNSIAPHLGLLGALVVGLMRGRGQVLRQQSVAAIEATPTSRLRSKPNNVCQVSQLRSIRFKPVKNGGGLISPDLIFELKTGRKQKYGIQAPDFEQACRQLKQLYPELCKAV
jgi:hypothetical protein